MTKQEFKKDPKIKNALICFTFEERSPNTVLTDILDALYIDLRKAEDGFDSIQSHSL